MAEKLERPSSSSAQTSPSRTQSGVLTACSSARAGREALGEVVAPAAAKRDVSAGDVRERAVAVPLDLEHPLVALRDVVHERRQHRRVLAVLRRYGRPVVPLAQDEPVLRVAGELRRHERPRSLEALAVEADRESAVPLLLQELICARVPDLDLPRAVLALRNLALEVRVLERVVFHVDREPLLAGLQRHALRNRPARKRPVPLQSEVVVEPARVVALDDEDRLLRALLPGKRLRSLLRISLLSILPQAHKALSVCVEARSPLWTTSKLLGSVTDDRARRHADRLHLPENTRPPAGCTPGI